MKEKLSEEQKNQRDQITSALKEQCKLDESRLAAFKKYETDLGYSTTEGAEALRGSRSVVTYSFEAKFTELALNVAIDTLGKWTFDWASIPIGQWVDIPSFFSLEFDPTSEQDTKAAMREFSRKFGLNKSRLILIRTSRLWSED